MHHTKINFFIDGLEEDNTAFDARTLSGSIIDFAAGTVQIGQSFNGEMLNTEGNLSYSVTFLFCLFPKTFVKNYHQPGGNVMQKSISSRF